MKLRGLPPALDGFRIGQTTDLHVGNFIDPEHVAQAVETLNEAGVDLQVMTGDLIDDMVRIPQTFAALEQCKAKYGMLAILGNHEKYFGLPQVLRAYEGIASRGKVRLLVDSSVVIEHQGHPVRIVGVDYPVYPGMDHPLTSAQTMALMKKSAEKAFTDIGQDETVFCLAHHPNFFPLAAERGALLTLSGHTHGGQVAMMGVSLFSFAFKYILGTYQLGNSHLYVSGGTGHWIPIRFGVPTEVTVLTLRSA
jgi:predicted MPP superfamily phosphohydrolase